MKKWGITSLAAAFVLTGGMTVLPASPAYAQQGARICGWTAVTSTGVVGFLYEGNPSDQSFRQQCSDVITSFWSKIQSDPSLKSLPWVKKERLECEMVGPQFLSANSRQDMCDQMAQKAAYRVTKTTASNSTVYTKI